MSNVGIVSVWSSYGHRFMSTDTPEHESCLVCGAMFQLLADDDDPSHGYYCSNDGSEPMHCTGDTSMVHGYAGERVPCEQHNGKHRWRRSTFGTNVVCDGCNLLPLDAEDSESGCPESCEHCNHTCNCLFCDS